MALSNPFTRNPLTTLTAVSLLKVPEMVETHEPRKAPKAWLAPRVPGGEPLPPAVVSRKGRAIVIQKASDDDEPVMH